MFYNKFTKKDPVAEEIEKIISERWDDDDEDDDVKKADAELRRMKAKPIEADKKTDPDKEIGKLAKKTPKEVDEEVVVEGSGPKEKQHTPYMPIAQRSKEGREIMKQREAEYEQEKKAKAAAKIGMKKEDKWTDIADGPWKKSKRTPGQAASAAANAAGKGLKGAQHKLDVAKPKGKLTAADFKKLRKEDAEQIDEINKKSFLGKIARGDEARKKGWGQFGKLITHSKSGGDQKEAEKAIRNSNRYYNLINGGKKGKTTGGFPKSTHNEEFDLSEKTLTPAESKKKEEIVKSMKKSKKDLKSRNGKRWKEVAYATATKSAKRVAENLEEAKGPTSTYGLDTFAKEANEPITPLSRAKEMARTAMNRIKNEMLGKAGATSEEIDPTIKSTDTLKGRTKGGKDDDVGPSATGRSTKVKYTPGPK